MAKRSELREWAVQLAYQHDFNPPDNTERFFEAFWVDKKPGAKGRQFTEELVRGLLSHMAQVDEVIQRHAANWDVPRIAAVERSIIRLAVFEMLFRPDIPPVVSINEAVTLARVYGDPGAGRFVNGILDQVRIKLDRPARTAGVGKVTRI
jgi:N utilization substance protein B